MAPLPPTRERPVGGANSRYTFPSGVLPGGEPPKRKRRWLKRIAILLVIIMAVVAGAAGAVVFVAKKQIDAFVTPKTAAMRKTQSVLAKPQAGKPTNILLLGSDNRAGAGTAGSNSDTLMLVRLNPQTDTISILSFPRDLYVPIPGRGQAKINSAYADGGPKLTVQTIKQLTGLDVNFVMNVDFKGFRQVVDQLGGIYIDVDRRYYVPPGAGYDSIDLQPGYQRLRGKDALSFARHRHTDSDFHRIARQQLVLTSLKKQLAASPLRKNIPSLLRILKQNTDAVAGGGDSVSLGVLKSFITLGLNLDGKDIYQIEYKGSTGNAADGESIVNYDASVLKGDVDAFLNPSKDARDKTADALVGKSATDTSSASGGSGAAAPTAPDPSTVTVTVRNGSGVGGVATSMAGELRTAGYQVSGSQTNADNQNYANTRVQYRTADGQAAAQALAAQIQGATAEQATSSNTFDTKLLVIVGKTGTSLSGSAASNGTSSGGSANSGVQGVQYAGNVAGPEAAAQVTTDREYGKEDFLDLASASKKPAFPILYPTVRPTGSTFEGVNRYKVAKGLKTFYDSYRLVGKIASDGVPAYWGLQATAWPDPPLLDNPTREITRGTRTYELYFNGTKLHMIAWHQGAGTYWIANTLLDVLNNKTMLAIAQGVAIYR